MNNLDINVFFIIVGIIILICYYNENKFIEYFTPKVVTRGRYQGNMTAKRCQDLCERKKYRPNGRWWNKWPCKYAITRKGLHKTGKKGFCVHTYGKDQYTINKDAGNGYDVWFNKKYKKPEIWKWKTIRLGNMGMVRNPNETKKKTGFIFPDRKERQIRKLEWIAKGKDQGWGNKTRSSYVKLYNTRGGRPETAGWNWLPRINSRGNKRQRSIYKRHKGIVQKESKNFKPPYPKFDKYQGISKSRGQGHRNITTDLRLKVNYLED